MSFGNGAKGVANAFRPSSMAAAKSAMDGATGIRGSKAIGAAGTALSLYGLGNDIWDMAENGVSVDNGMSAATNATGALLGATTLPEHFERTRAAVEELTRHVSVAMAVRRRRFVYPAPPGWTANCRGFETEWYPPGFESDPARLTVFPAVEHRGGGAPDTLMGLLEQQLDVSPRFADAEWTESMTRTGSGLCFLRSTAEVRGRLTELAVAVDASYIYAFRFEGSARHRPILDAALAGVIPLAPAEAPSLSALSHWAE